MVTNGMSTTTTTGLRVCEKVGGGWEGEGGSLP